MGNIRYRYSDQDLREAVESSVSIMEVMRKLGIRMAGGSHYHLSGRIRKAEISTEHFTGQAHNRGRGLRKRTVDEILVILPEDSSRPKAKQLLRAMIESGIDYRCAKCGLTEWQDGPITLDIDHQDGNWLNNLLSNLRLLCPNCHRQTETFGSKNRKLLLT